MSMASITVVDARGARSLPLPLRLDAAHAGHLLPEPVEGAASIERGSDGWWLRNAGGAVRVNGRVQQGDVQLGDGDVLEAGGAQLVLFDDASPPHIAVHPLRGNETVPPLEVAAMPGEEVIAGTREIHVADAARSGSPAAAVPEPRRIARGAGFALLAVLAGVALFAVFSMVPLPVELDPPGARIRSDGLQWQRNDTLFVRGGTRRLVVESPGYEPLQLTLEVDRALAARGPVRLALQPLPGIVDVDTGGIEAEVLVDGMPAGTAPGVVSMAAGRRAVLVRAPQRVDFVTELEVTGRGEQQALEAVLAPAWGTLEVDTRPAGARVFVDGREIGTAPQRLDLDSGLHQLELRAPGRRNWRSEVAILAGQTLTLGPVDLANPPPPVARTASAPGSEVADPAADSAEPAPQAAAPPPPRRESPLLGTLILVPAGTFEQGSERREQGRRSNEPRRTVTLTRPFYLAEHEVTNAQFRAFRADHASGIAADRTLDLDNFPVSGVSWDDAVAFCNWLSQREGLPLAYERRDGRWQLVEPATGGYRLPTEAEWEYAARYVDGRRFNRYSWGDALPVPARAENLAGNEINEGLPPQRHQPALPDFRDEHVVVAPVGAYGRTAHGFADMGGNVSEWVHDAYSSLLPADAVTDPREDGAGAHVIRGANWRTSGIAALRLAWRDSSTGPQQTLGFRVARSVETSP